MKQFFSDFLCSKISFTLGVEGRQGERERKGERVGGGDKTRDCHNYCWRVTRVLCSAQSVLSDNDNWSFSWKLEKKFIIRASEFRRERRRDVEQQFQNNEMQWERAKTNKLGVSTTVRTRVRVCVIS